jgi:hypothetical protein
MPTFRASGHIGFVFVDAPSVLFSHNLLSGQQLAFICPRWKLALFCTNPHHRDMEDAENEIEAVFVRETKIASVISVPPW